MEHFGCRVMTNEPKLTRSNYAPITLATRKNGFMKSSKYLVGKKGHYSSIDEALSDFFKYEGDSIVEKYMNELDTYRKRINDIKTDSNLAKGYYASFINFEHKRCISSFFRLVV